VTALGCAVQVDLRVAFNATPGVMQEWMRHTLVAAGEEPMELPTLRLRLVKIGSWLRQQVSRVSLHLAAAHPGAGMPTGSVAFTLGSTNLGSGTVNGMGMATLPTTALPVGANQTVTTTYSGDTNFATSSGTTSVTVNAVTITLTAATGNGSGNSGTASAPSIRAGSSITLGANPNTGVTYTSSNANIATVDPTTGVVTGIAGGTVTITVGGPNGSSGSMVVTVTGARRAACSPRHRWHTLRGWRARRRQGRHPLRSHHAKQTAPPAAVGAGYRHR